MRCTRCILSNAVLVDHVAPTPTQGVPFPFEYTAIQPKSVLLSNNLKLTLINFHFLLWRIDNFKEKEKGKGRQIKKGTGT